MDVNVSQGRFIGDWTSRSSARRAIVPGAPSSAASTSVAPKSGDGTTTRLSPSRVMEDAIGERFYEMAEQTYRLHADHIWGEYFRVVCDYFRLLARYSFPSQCEDDPDCG